MEMEYSSVIGICDFMKESVGCLVFVAADNELKFPKGFLFGAASSAFQIEGVGDGNNTSPSTADYYYNSLLKYSLAKDACKSYTLYERDVEIVGEIGLDFYRFSISWSRLFPTGFTNQINTDGLNYYNNLINKLIKKNIKPMVTLLHFDPPQYLQNLGGMANPSFADWFADYAAFVFEEFGDRVKYWYTINEPEVFCSVAYSGIPFPPAINATGVGEYMCIYNAVRAHAKAYRIYEDRFKSKQNGKIGMTHNVIWPEAEHTDDANMEKSWLHFWIGLIGEPVYGQNGDFPNEVKERVQTKSLEQGFATSRLPKFTLEEVDYIKGAYDFIGVTYYFIVKLVAKRDEISKPRQPSLTDDMGLNIDLKYLLQHGSTFFEPDARSFRKVLNYIKTKYNNPEVIISENGISTSAGLNDDLRVNILRKFLGELLKAIHEDGCNIKGYTFWSLMDNFEWFGSPGRARYGLYEVDFTDPNRKRTARKSAHVYKKIIRDRMIDWEYDPKHLNIHDV